MEAKVVQVKFNNYVNLVDEKRKLGKTDDDDLEITWTPAPAMPPSKHYSYFTDIEDLKVGDLVVVENNGEFKVVTVVKTIGLTKTQTNNATKWIVSKIDITGYIDKLRKMELVQEIKNELHKRKEEMQEYLLFKQLAETDPKIKDLLSELEKVDPTLVPQIPGQTPPTVEDKE